MHSIACLLLLGNLLAGDVQMGKALPARTKAASERVSGGFVYRPFSEAQTRIFDSLQSRWLLVATEIDSKSNVITRWSRTGDAQGLVTNGIARIQGVGHVPGLFDGGMGGKIGFRDTLRADGQLWKGFQCDPGGLAAARRLHGFIDSLARSPLKPLPKASVKPTADSRNSSVPAAETKAQDFAPSPSDSAEAGSAGTRSPASIQRVIRAHMPGLAHTLRKYQREDPDLKGRVVVRFTILPDGSIETMKAVSSTTGNERFDQEIVSKALRWRFEPVEKGNVTITFPLEFDSN